MIIHFTEVLPNVIKHRKTTIKTNTRYICTVDNTVIYDYQSDWGQETAKRNEVFRLKEFDKRTAVLMNEHHNEIKLPLEQFLICFDEFTQLYGAEDEDTVGNGSIRRIIDGMKKNPPFIFDDSEIKIEQVNHPEHYNKGIEAIKYIESWDMNFNLGNVVKYVTRAPFKGNYEQDLKKAMWYIQRELDRCCECQKS